MLRDSLIRHSPIVIRQFFLLIALGPASPLTGDDGEVLYRLHCAACHGARGEGGRGASLAKAKLERASDEKALITLITQGIPGTEMVGARLTAAEISQVAAWVRK